MDLESRVYQLDIECARFRMPMIIQRQDIRSYMLEVTLI